MNTNSSLGIATFLINEKQLKKQPRAVHTIGRHQASIYCVSGESARHREKIKVLGNSRSTRQWWKFDIQIKKL